MGVPSPPNPDLSNNNLHTNFSRNKMAAEGVTADATWALKAQVSSMVRMMREQSTEMSRLRTRLDESNRDTITTLQRLAQLDEREGRSVQSMNNLKREMRNLKQDLAECKSALEDVTNIATGLSLILGQYTLDTGEG